MSSYNNGSFTISTSIRVDVRVPPPPPITFTHTPSPVLPTLTISGSNSKLANSLFEAWVPSDERKQFALVLASDAVSERQKKKLLEEFNNAFKRPMNKHMFNGFRDELRRLNEVRKHAHTNAPPAEEPGFRLERRVVTQDIFELRISKIPRGAMPIYDEQTRAVIGYSVESAKGVFRLYDLEGNFVGMDELPLERPFFDLDDILLIGLTGGLMVVKRLLGLRGALAAGRRLPLTKAGLKAGARNVRTISLAAVNRMRGVIQRDSVKNLKFTRTTIARMNDPDRHVPAHLLDLATKYGKASPDPHGVPGLIRYTTPFTRAGKEYTLEVVVRVRDRTIMHFEYFK